MLRREQAADRDPFKDWQVKRYSRKLERQTAVITLDTDHAIKRAGEDARLTIESARITLQKQAGLASVKAEGRADIERSKGAFPMPIDTTRAIRDGKRAKSKQHALATIVRAVAADPDITQTQIAALTGKSRQSISAYMAELAEQGQLTRTASGHYAPAGENGNGQHQ